MNRHAPVHLSADHALDGRASQTFLRHLNLCPRSGFLYALLKGEASSAKMMRGQVVHRILELATRAMVEQDEERIPEPLVKAIAEEVFADPDYPLPLEEHDYVRESAYRWAKEFQIRGVPVANERLVELEWAGWTVRCRVDYAEQRDGPLYIADYKSGRGAPAFSKITRKRPDGTHRMIAFQLVLYALALTARWDGYGGTSIYPGVNEVLCEFVYPGIAVGDDGRMLRQTATITRRELEEDAQSLTALLAQLDERQRSGDWPAVVSDEACSICPAEALCPIPRELNPHRVDLDGPDACAAALEYHDLAGMLQGRLGDRIKAYLRASGPVRYGGNMVALVELDRSNRGRLVKRPLTDEEKAA